jgi:hypothetical protein
MWDNWRVFKAIKNRCEERIAKLCVLKSEIQHTFQQCTVLFMHRGHLRWTHFRTHYPVVRIVSHNTKLTRDCNVHVVGPKPCSEPHALKQGVRRITTLLLYLCKRLWNSTRPWLTVTDDSSCQAATIPLGAVESEMLFHRTSWSGWLTLMFRIQEVSGLGPETAHRGSLFLLSSSRQIWG